jgi:glutathione synthase/RimK-type ligase-like ATP-grasp enzyme
MSTATVRPLAVYYEHPDWFRPLFAELDRRGTPYVKLPVGSHRYDPSELAQPYPVVFNRMSPSAYTRGHGRAIFYTSQFLSHLERRGVRVINGARAWRTEVSKADQLSLLDSLGLPYPRARVIHDPAHAPAAARGLRFPVVVKPNVGGSGAGIRRFDALETLERAAAEGALELGIDGTALVQEYIPARDGRIVRVEVLDGRYLYAIRIYTPGDQFNLCPADVCQRVDGAELERKACALDAPKNGLRVEGYEPPAEVVNAVERIMSASGIELGGVEYMIDDRDGQLYYYDVNALSNFVADAPRVIGFDPFATLADWLERELAARSEGFVPRAAKGTRTRERATAAPVAGEVV